MIHADWLRLRSTYVPVGNKSHKNQGVGGLVLVCALTFLHDMESIPGVVVFCFIDCWVKAVQVT